LVPSADIFEEDFKLLGRLAVPGSTDVAVGTGGIPGTPDNCWWCE